jgi:hypothetical protein
MNNFTQALDFYRAHHVLNQKQHENDNKFNTGSNIKRLEQVEILTKLFSENFNFDTINCVETGGSHRWNDGKVGIFFAYLSHITGGKFTSVDINPDISTQVIDSYSQVNLSVDHYIDDSINYLKNLDYIPNLVHLDSWDVDLKDPFPSALHGWREFEAIEHKMPVGSIIVIDDNWYKNNWVEWLMVSKNEHDIDILSKEIITMEYPCVGKGAHVYQWIKSGNSNWKILDASYKLTIQKVSNG